MIYSAERAKATPKARGECPLCGATLIAKCGPIVTWHWAHEADFDCDPWTEPESDWHRAWKAMFEQAGYRIEVVMGPHRADVVSPTGHIIELQHDYQKADTITEREQFYGPGMSWLYRCFWADRLGYEPHHGFRWAHAAPSMERHERPVVWEIDGQLRRIRLARDRSDDVVGRYGAMIDPEEAPDRWGELLDDPVHPLAPVAISRRTVKRLDELQRARLDEIRSGKWPAASLAEWSDVLARPYRWHDLTVRHAREIVAAAQGQIK